MPQISLTDFVDIVSKAGRPKATKVKQVKERPDYEPAFDFYKPLRDRIVDTHRLGGDKKKLSEALTGINDPKKLKNYPDLVAGYRKWWGKKTLEWFNPPRESYSSNGFDISVNPELGLKVNGHRHVIKLYFKAQALSAFHVELITCLMEHQLRDKVGPDDIFAVLDVKNSRLFQGAAGALDALPMIDAEIAYIASIWGK